MQQKYLCLAAGLLCAFPSPISGQTIQRFDIVIDELLPDPSPAVQLPNSEFIELKNVSNKSISLHNCTITDGSTTATITTPFILQPDSFVIICPNATVPVFRAFGNTIGVSNFPSLNNDADIISLYAPNGALIHSLAYHNTWYQNAVKSEGGWSLEMIDTQNPCAGAGNWKASTHSSGGTPGQPNSVNAINPDELPPALLRTYTVDSTTIVAIFDEPVDSSSATNPANYSLQAIGHPLTASVRGPSLTEILLKFAVPIQAKTTYELVVGNITDCAGLAIGHFNKAKAGLPMIADSLAIVINELLFNPPPDGYDYIELYNGGNTVIDLNHIYIANRNAMGQATNIIAASTTPHLFFPGQHIVLTENKAWLQQQYLIKDPSVIIQVNAMPSMPDDKGDIILINQQGNIIDQLHYDDSWHFALLDNKEGVALERIHYNYGTQERSNWTSAASTSRYGTPGLTNSQMSSDVQLQGQVSIAPPVFSPNNDGHDDFATIHLQLAEPGYTANITIFDAHGYRVRSLVQQATLSSSARFQWEGLNDQSKELPTGAYVVLTELFHANGRTRRYKNVVTLLGR